MICVWPSFAITIGAKLFSPLKRIIDQRHRLIQIAEAMFAEGSNPFVVLLYSVDIGRMVCAALNATFKSNPVNVFDQCLSSKIHKLTFVLIEKLLFDLDQVDAFLERVVLGQQKNKISALSLLKSTSVPLLTILSISIGSHKTKDGSKCRP